MSQIHVRICYLVPQLLPTSEVEEDRPTLTLLWKADTKESRFDSALFCKSGTVGGTSRKLQLINIPVRRVQE